jgi:hypothetical protein
VSVPVTIACTGKAGGGGAEAACGLGEQLYNASAAISANDNLLMMICLMLLMLIVCCYIYD